MFGIDPAWLCALGFFAGLVLLAFDLFNPSDRHFFRFWVPLAAVLTTALYGVAALLT